VEKNRVPITFNACKHHFGFLKQQIEEWKKTDWHVVEKELLCIGENLLDFYTGRLSVENIYNECLEYFRARNINNLQAFEKWLGTEGYKKAELSDFSQWVIKQGVNKKRYIHIHPAKYSEHTLRIRAVTLKTVCVLQILSVPVQENMNENLQQVNRIRKTYLHLSPVKSLSYGKGIFKIWRLFEEG